MRPIDQEICSLLKVRKIGGMELLFREYYKPLVVWATTFLHDTQRAEDIVQDFFVKLWEKPYSALLPETLKSYLFTSIRNLALNQLDKMILCAGLVMWLTTIVLGRSMITLRTKFFDV